MSAARASGARGDRRTLRGATDRQSSLPHAGRRAGRRAAHRARMAALRDGRPGGCRPDLAAAMTPSRRRGGRGRPLRSLCRVARRRGRRIARERAHAAPRRLDFAAIPGLSTEMVERLTAARPARWRRRRACAASRRRRCPRSCSTPAGARHDRRRGARTGRQRDSTPRRSTGLIGWPRSWSAESERQNLISRSTLDSIWSRHIVDSPQLVAIGAPVGCGSISVPARVFRACRRGGASLIER